MERQRDNRVRLNVGGRIFETTSTTLARAGSNSFLFNLNNNPTEEHFIDRDPDCFSILLGLLRTGQLHIPHHVPENLVYAEALFYGLLDHVRAARWGPLDGSRLHLARSVSGRAPGEGKAIGASPDGGCCVARGSVIHVYDWMLNGRPTINLDHRYQWVNDLLWVDSENIAASACDRSGGNNIGWLRLFASSSGELRHRFRVNQDKDDFMCWALASNPSDYRLFASCRGTEFAGIGVWDQVTGQQIEFLYDEERRCSFGQANRLQWLASTNCLLAASLGRGEDNCVTLLDFRDRRSTVQCSVSRYAVDAIAVEGTNSICLASEFGDLLDPVDMRIDWRLDPAQWGEPLGFPHKRSPKLAYNNGQVFCSHDDCISVFCGPGLVPTSSLKNSFGAPICDISIGGDRLFALHRNGDVFDIWETTKSAPLAS